MVKKTNQTNSSVTADAGSLFVWRGMKSYSGGIWGDWPKVEYPEVYDGYRQSCPFCKTVIVNEGTDAYSWHGSCNQCGFSYLGHKTSSPDEPSWDEVSEGFATLRELAVNDSAVAFDELGAHLARRFNDTYLLTPRRFEEVVADVYRQSGYFARLTQQTRDGGYDVMLMEHSSGTQTIVECKRYARTCRVSVGTVRELLGVQLALAVPRAAVVTSGYFTEPALQIAKQVNEGNSAYSLELVDADRLIDALGVYNTRLPPLRLDSRFLER